jgi:alpha-2-macroglobulin
LTIQAKPLEILENALKIALNDADRARAHYLIAMTLRNQSGDYRRLQQVPEEFEAALSAGRANKWYDDALYHYAVWIANQGRIKAKDYGRWQPDYVKARELYRRLVTEYAKGETRYYDQALAEIEAITKPVVGVSAANIFLPGSEIQYHLNWRNVKRIEIALYPVDLTRDLQFIGRQSEEGDWIQKIDLSGSRKLHPWAKETDDQGDYRPGQEAVRLNGKIPTGAYVIEARSGKAGARDLLLVTDTALVLKVTEKQALAYFCDAISGAPLTKARVKLWARYFQDQGWEWRESAGETNQDGIAVFDLAESRFYRPAIAVAAIENRQAFSHVNYYNHNYEEGDWRIYAFTDRPAYRPNEVAQWKFIARKYQGSTYSTPANQTIEYQIHDPRGTLVKQGKAELNAFGSAWGSLELTEGMALGEYHISFPIVGGNHHINNPTLFRLEEYKLPEFQVSVRTPEENGRKKAFQLGDRVEVNVQADYYFGGPVTNATVEVLVRQSPFHHWWQPQRDFPWYYANPHLRNRYYNSRNGQIIKRETIRTDASGKATLTFDTPRESLQNFEYQIEARVTDASRREITGSGTVRVTLQRYYLYPHAKGNLYRPQDKVAVDLKALDANDQPMQVEGTVKVTRDNWYEIWLDPNGREVKGEELKRLREKGAFPPLTSPGSRGTPWRLAFRGYQSEVITTQPWKTNAEGEAGFSFTPAREGFYRIAWNSADRDGAPIKAESAVWVTTNATTELGYRHGGLEIIADRDTFQAGERAQVMLHTPVPDRYVLFSIESDDLHSYRLIHLSGTVEVIEVPIAEEHTPNVFLTAVMVNDSQIFKDAKQIIIPPAQHFLAVDVKPDREQYEPREEGTFTVTTRDRQGRPVSAELALGLVDESVSYIQQDYAGDPRQFYYGAKRQLAVQTNSTFQNRSYTKLVEGADKNLVEERVSLLRAKNEEGYQAGDVFLRRESADRSYSERQTAQLNGGVSGVAGSFFSLNMFAMNEMAQSAARESVSYKMAESALANILPSDTPQVQEPAVQVRSDFRATVFWQPGIITDEDGKATVKVKFPDSLTRWKATARVATESNQFGIASASVRTKQPLIVRLQMPRFLVAGDIATISAVINNNTDQPMDVAPSLEAEGLNIGRLITSGKPINDVKAAITAEGPNIITHLTSGKPIKDVRAAVTVEANGEARVDWLVIAERLDNAKLRVTARGDKYADAMEREINVNGHGIEKFVARSGKLRGDDLTLKLDLPKERETTSLTVQITPSLAVTMLDSLPYLIDYPYGCTEQTMSRFLPAAIAAKTLKDLGLKPEAVMSKMFGGIEPEHADKTHSRGKKLLGRLAEMIERGLARLYDFQHADGGWGWWKEGESDHFMTAYVVWGLTLARAADLQVSSDVVARAVDYLDKELVEEESNYDRQAWMLHAIAACHAAAKPSRASRFQTKAFDNLWSNRERLNAYTRALLALSAHYFGHRERAMTLVRNLENGAQIDKSPDASIIQSALTRPEPDVIGTAHWGEDGIYRRWSDGGVEATSFALRALLAIEPKHKLIEPATNWLIKNRRGAQWSNTRDTAITVLTLNDYLRASGELAADFEYELSVNGQRVAANKIAAADLFSAPSRFEIQRELLIDGANEIRIRRKNGRGPIYVSAQAQFFSREEPITESGNEIFVRRQYYKLAARPTLLNGHVYERVLLGDGYTMASGERVEAVITIETKNNYEYLLFEDLKPAGLEAVELRSGSPLYARELKSGAAARKFATYPETPGEADSQNDFAEDTNYTGRRHWVYQELRDRKVALFIDKLPQGIWEIRYQMRAETTGRFHALPVIGHAMYAPEIRANGIETRLKVEE